MHLCYTYLHIAHPRFSSRCNINLKASALITGLPHVHGLYRRRYDIQLLTYICGCELIWRGSGLRPSARIQHSIRTEGIFELTSAVERILWNSRGISGPLHTFINVKLIAIETNLHIRHDVWDIQLIIVETTRKEVFGRALVFGGVAHHQAEADEEKKVRPEIHMGFS